ncbi:MAG TPA: hypothetical protein VMF61_02220, partial [Candidatus Acidoferrales bacterium]|nr:hypothetical protein [Candidatus Acidoferrales bacterium]
KGLKAEVKMSASNAKAGAIFVVGEGTSDADITGTYAGAKFPLFASKGAPCYAVTAKGSDKPAKCVGKGFLYMIVTNQGKSTVTFKGTPAVTISGKLPGTKRCEIDGLVSAGAKGKFGWAMLPIYGVPKAGSVAFASAPSTLAFKSGSAYIFGYSCE